MELNVSNTSCLFPQNVQDHLAISRGSVGGAAILVCIVSLIAWLFKGRQEFRRELVHRQFIYLSLINIVNLLAFVLQYIEDVRDRAYLFCSVVGCFVQFTSCLQLFMVFWVTCNLCVTYKPKNYEKIDDGDQDEVGDDLNGCMTQLTCKTFRPIRSKVCAEITCFIVILTLSVLLSIFPWIRNDYGIFANGGLCWIRGEKNCIYDAAGVAQQWILWYIPVLIVGIIATPILLCFSCHYARKNYKDLKIEHQSPMIKDSKQKRNAMSIVLAIYLIVYVTLASIQIVTRFIVLVERKSSQSIGNESVTLWILYALAVPTSVALLPLAFLIYLCVAKKHYRDEQPFLYSIEQA